MIIVYHHLYVYHPVLGGVHPEYKTALIASLPLTVFEYAIKGIRGVIGLMFYQADCLEDLDDEARAVEAGRVISSPEIEVSYPFFKIDYRPLTEL